ncbi:MAG: DUF4105 domain-containing protein [Bacteroidia bacterium]|nr:DUF4105 domain-containing protein [Bacteroidia bacterium]
MKYFLLFFLLLFSGFQVQSQYKQLSPNSSISVLTIGPGKSLNDSFGHSAYRVKDSLIDIVFNYGVYDFTAPNFYTKFAQGKLNYKIDANYYEDFRSSYIRQNRTIKEQVLNLSKQEKQQVFNFLSRNYEPANQYYLYDFFYDNCATKIRDVLVNSLDNKVDFPLPDEFEQKTFRTLIHQNLNWNSWGSLGIDLALGSVIDRKASPVEHMFLPEYIYDFFDAAIIKQDKNKKLVKKELIIYKKTGSNSTVRFLLSPLFILGIIGIIILFITYNDYKKNNRSKWLDILLFGTTGSIGILILLLWFATDHEATAQNYNLLWAFVINLFMIFQLAKDKPGNWFIKYLKFLIIMLFLLTMHWLIGIQKFAFSLIPLLMALAIRYIYLIKIFQKQ